MPDEIGPLLGLTGPLRLAPYVLQLGANRLELACPSVQDRPRFAGGDCLDAPRADADRLLAEDHERADLGGRADVRAAAELAGEAADLDDAHLVAVLLAEQHHGAELARLVDRRQKRPDGDRLEHLVVDDPLHLVPLFGCQSLAVGEVEAQLVGADRRAGLLHVVAQHLPQCRVQQVGRRVVRHGREAVAPVDDRLDAGAGLERRVPGQLDQQHLVVAELADVDDRQALLFAVDLEVAGVADLAAAGGVERALLDLDELPCSSR